MILIAAVDENNGMMFNHRRQSQDRILRERILALSGQSRLWMNHYSAKQFEVRSNLIVDEDFLEKAAPGEYCFVENIPAAPYENKMEQIILFQWNRRYPADFYFDLDPAGNGWKLTSVEEFSGSSHEKITMEVFEPPVKDKAVHSCDFP